MSNTVQAWRTPLALIPDQFRLKQIRDASGNVKTWEEIYDKDPNYEIYTDINGKPINPTTQNTIWKDNENRISASEQGHMDRVNADMADNERIRTQVSGMLEYVPFVGDGIEGYNIFENLHQGNYYNAGLGFVGLLLPNALEETGKVLYKTGRYFLNNKTPKTLRNFTAPIVSQHINPVKQPLRYTGRVIDGFKNRYIPAMSISEKREWLTDLHNRLDEVAKFGIQYADRKQAIRYNNGVTQWHQKTALPLSERISQGRVTPYFWTFSKNGDQVLAEKGYLGTANPITKELRLKLRDTKKGKNGKFYNEVILRGKDEIINEVAPHEFNHYSDYNYSDMLDLNVVRDGGYTFNPDSSYRPWFTALEKNQSTNWISDPLEFSAEKAMLHSKFKKLDLKDFSPEQTKEARQYMANQFNLKLSEAAQMLRNWEALGLKNGGVIYK